MAIERHLVGVRRLDDRFDADAADAVAMKEIERASDDALARPLGGRVRLVRTLRHQGVVASLQIFLRHGS